VFFQLFQFERDDQMSDELVNNVDIAKIEAAVKQILEAVGEDPMREGLLDTPKRVARMYAELLAGMQSDPAEHIHVFHEEYDEIVLLRDIPFYSVCEHHMMPFIGKAHVAYLPDGNVIGISKLARIVDCYARRLQVQERLTIQVAEFLMEHLKPKGVAVVIEASHSCTTLRGIRKSGSVMVTSALRGLFKSDPRSRSEVLSLINRSS
jgi:GTP cyclohydrolase I